MKEAREDAASLEPILSFKKNLEGELVVTLYRTLHFFMGYSDAEFHAD